jgi:hypothetical protein
VSQAVRVHLARELRDRIDESNVLAFRLIETGRESRLSGLCRCGREVSDPTSALCGPCGRDDFAVPPGERCDCGTLLQNGDHVRCEACTRGHR